MIYIVSGKIESGKKLAVGLMIFDAIGNYVHGNENDDITDLIPEEIKKQQGLVKICIPWYGISDRGMKASPGIYRAVIFTKVEGESPNKSVVNIAVGRAVN